jgi:hypothetical protein
LLLTHHDPLRSDEQLDLIQNQLKEKAGATIAFDMAAEGTTFEL